jgi:hypothetical protein
MIFQIRVSFRIFFWISSKFSLRFTVYFQSWVFDDDLKCKREDSCEYTWIQWRFERKSSRKFLILLLLTLFVPVIVWIHWICTWIAGISSMMKVLAKNFWELRNKIPFEMTFCCVITGLRLVLRNWWELVVIWCGFCSGLVRIWIFWTVRVLRWWTCSSLFLSFSEFVTVLICFEWREKLWSVCDELLKSEWHGNDWSLL